MISEYAHLLGGPFDTVLDVGGNVGDFAEEAAAAWPAARVLSFEPIPELAAANLERADGRWQVYTLAISAREGRATLHVCENQHSASTMQQAGNGRRRHFGLRDSFKHFEVATAPLDDLLGYADGRVLVKVDVEGHEGQVLAGGRRLLEAAETVVVEVQNDPAMFLGALRPHEVAARLERAGLRFAGVAGVLVSGKTAAVLQFDGVWRRTLPVSEEARLGILQPVESPARGT